MATKKSVQRVGFREVITQANFFKFENPGDEFHGVFLEANERQNKKYANAQIVWTVVNMSGEIFQIGEKTVMATFRLQLKKGDEFILIYNGEVTPDKGTAYKSFSFYLKDKE